MTKTYTSTELAHKLDIPSAKALHNVLKAKGVIKRISDRWVFTREFCGRGYGKTVQYNYGKNTDKYSVTLKWTQKGACMVQELLRHQKTLFPV